MVSPGVAARRHKQAAMRRADFLGLWVMSETGSSAAGQRFTEIFGDGYGPVLAYARGEEVAMASQTCPATVAAGLR